jgi:hypothetical protein
MMARPRREFMTYVVGADTAFKLPADARTRAYWDAWACAAAESGMALQAWMSAERPDRKRGYHAYVACLDREEQAAAVLMERIDPGAAARLGLTG